MARVVMMGVSGSGKTTVGRALADRLGVPFVEADDLHPPANVAKMASGRPLTEEDRRPWLAAVRRAMADRPRVVCACSALSRAARAELRAVGGVGFCHLVVGRELAERRLAGRTGHFMGPAMVASQFDALEAAGADEPDVVEVDADGTVAEVLDRAQRALALIGLPG